MILENLINHGEHGGCGEEKRTCMFYCRHLSDQAVFRKILLLSPVPPVRPVVQMPFLC
jgi:hypothetical protein